MIRVKDGHDSLFRRDCGTRIPTPVRPRLREHDLHRQAGRRLQDGGIPTRRSRREYPRQARRTTSDPSSSTRRRPPHAGHLCIHTDSRDARGVDRHQLDTTVDRVGDHSACPFGAQHRHRGAITSLNGTQCRLVQALGWTILLLPVILLARLLLCFMAALLIGFAKALQWIQRIVILRKSTIARS